MFARVSHVRYPPQHYDAGLRVVAEELLPALLRAPGYRGCCLLASGKPGTGLAVVLWESEEAADAAAIDGAVAAAHVELAALGLEIEARKIYEVIARDACGREPS
jgi:heme-degrading monooxygenase HmoA